MRVPTLDVSQGHLQGIERCLRQVLQILPTLEARGDNTSIMTANTGQGTVFNVNKDYIRGLLGRSGSNFFNLTEAMPKAYTNYCTIFEEGESVELEPTQTYIKNCDDSVYVGLGPQILNINGMIKNFKYEDLPLDPEDVGSRSFYDPGQVLANITPKYVEASRRVMGLWKVSDLILQSSPNGGIDTVIRNNYSNVAELSFLLRLKCTLTKSDVSTDPTFMMPWVYTWKIRPSMIFEGGYADYNNGIAISFIGYGCNQYFNGISLPDDWSKVTSWYVPVGRVTLTNCTEFVKNVCSNVTPNNATFDISVQTINFTPILTIALTNAQIQNILNINNAVNNQ